MHFLKGRCIPLYQVLQLLRGLGEWVKYHTLLSIAGNHFGGSHSLWLYDSSWLLAEFLSQLKIIPLVNHYWLWEYVAGKGWSLISFQKKAVINPERVWSYTWSPRGGVSRAAISLRGVHFKSKINKILDHHHCFCNGYSEYQKSKTILNYQWTYSSSYFKNSELSGHIE